MAAPIRLDFAASTSQARTEINALAATIDKLQAKMLAATGMKNTPLANLSTQQMALGDANNQLQTLGGRKVNLAEPIKQTEKLVDNINKGKISWDQYRQAAGSSSKVVAQQMALQRASISNIRKEASGSLVGDFAYGDLRKSTSALERLAMQARVAGAAGKALGQEWVDVGKNMAFSARQLTISLTAPFVVVSALSMKAYMDSAGALTDIAKVYGDSADGFTQSADKIKSEARDLARTMSDTYAASYEDTYNHQKFYAAQGLTGRELSGSTTQATRLQMLGDVDTESAQQSITTLTNVFGVQTEKMGEYVDYMNKIEDSTTLTMNDFAQAMPKMGPIVKSFEEDPKKATMAMAEMLEAGKRGGIQSATEIANAWKSIFTKVARPTEQLKDVWAELGAKNGVAGDFMGIVSKNGGDVMEIIKEISTLTADWGDTDKNRLFSQLAGAQQVARMTTFAEQLSNSSETIKGINEDFQTNPDSLADNSRRQQDMIMESAEKRWAQFVNKLKDVGVTIGAKVFPPIMKILETGASLIEKIVGAVEKIPGPFKTLMAIMGGFAVVLGPAIGVLGALIQVSGQLFKIWNVGRGAVGNTLNRMATGVKSTKLLTVSDAISNRASGKGFALEANKAIMDQESAARDKAVSGLNRFSTAIERAAVKMAAVPGALDRSQGAGLSESARAKREQRLTPATAPTLRNVYVPPKPDSNSTNLQDKVRYDRGVRLKQEADIENKAAMQQYKQHEDYRKRVESRYKSYSTYMTDTPQAKLDSNYKDFKNSTAPARLQNSDFMKRTQSTLNSGVLGSTQKLTTDQASQLKVSNATKGATGPINVMGGSGILDRQRVADKLAHTNRDYAMAINKRGTTDSDDKNWVKRHARVKALGEEQIRIQKVLKGSTADVSAEARKIEQSYQSTTKSGMQMVRGVLPSMRRQSDDFITGAHDGKRTGLTKSGLYQASDRNVAKTVRQAVKRDPNAFADYKNDQNAQTSIPIAGRRATGNLKLTPEIYSMAERQAKNFNTQQERINASQERIRENSEKWSAGLANSLAIGSSLMLMFGPDNAVVQGLATAGAVAGGIFSMMPETAQKVFEKVGTVMATPIENIKGKIQDKFTGGMEAMAAGAVGRMQAKFIGLSTWMKANSMALMGWGAAIAAAAVVGYVAIQKLQEGTKKQRELVQASIAEAKTLGDVLGYAYTEAMPERGSTSGIDEEIKETAEALKGLTTFEGTIESLRGRKLETTQDIDAMRLALNPKAIKILSSGGTEADVNKMVKSALFAAGADEVTIENFKLNLDLDNVESLFPSAKIDELRKSMTEMDGRRTGGDLISSVGGSMLKFWDQSDEKKDDAMFKIPAKQRAEEIMTDAKEALTVAGSEAKPEIAKIIAETMRIPEDTGSGQSHDAAIRAAIIRKQMVDDISKMNGNLNTDDGRKFIDSSEALAETVMAGEGAFGTAQEASDKYQLALQQLGAKGEDLSINQRRMISNIFRSGAGLEQLDESTASTVENIDKMGDAVAEVAPEPKGFNDFINDINSLGREAVSSTRTVASFNPVLGTLGNLLNQLPGDFSRRWNFYIDTTNAEETGTQLAGMLRGAGDKAKGWGAEFAAKQMDVQHQQATDSISAAGERSLKGLEAQQKSAEDAMKAQEKALDGKHKAQNKALENAIKNEQKFFDNQQKAEKKGFDDRQKADKKAFDKQQQAEKKLFDKDIERQKKDFENQWKTQEDAVKTYYETSRKYLDAQQAAEDKLDKSRERNAEAERKRQEMLNELSNKNVDINVAIAGGNLDEAAKLMSEANATAQTYYADSGQSMSDATSEDRSAARQVRQTGLSDQEKISNDVLALRKEQESEKFNEGLELKTEAFGEKQSGEAEGFGDKQNLESETFQEKLDRQKEEFQLQLDARKEQLQLQQDQEKEFLAAQQEAEKAYYDNKRSEIQATTDAAIKGAEAVHNDRKEKMALELELLKIGSAQSEEEVAASADRLIETYGKYGVELGAVGDRLKGGMLDNFHAGLDQSVKQINEDERWSKVGVNIGSMIKAGMDAGLKLTSSDILKMVTTGVVPLEIQRKLDDNAHANYANGPAKRATGGPIFGPGTATSDSIPAMLSNGEHVLTAAEVRALGGHAAVEKWRQGAMKGVSKFAAGGAVGSPAMARDAGLTVNVSSTGKGVSADGGVLSAVASDVQNLGQAFDSSLAKTAAPAWQLFGDQLIQIRDGSINPTFDAMNEAMAKVQAETTNTTSGVMTPAWYLFGQNLQNFKTASWDFVMETMHSGLTSLGTATNTAITGQLIPLWQQGANHIQNMQNNVIDPALRSTREATDATARNFGVAADMIGTGWAKVKENTAIPVRYTIDTVFNKGLVGMWNEVAGKLDLKKLDEFPLKFAEGGVLPGYTPGRDVHQFTSPTGGALHLSGGEAIMRPEWTKAVGGAGAVAKMNSDAKSGRVQKYADGGVFHAPGIGDAKTGDKPNESAEKPMATPYGMPHGINIGYGAGGFPGWVYNIGGQFGLQAATYPGHQENNVAAAGFMPNPQGQNRGIDWSGPVDKMHTFAQYLVANGPSMPQLEQVIWMHPSTGQKLGWFGNGPDMSGSIYSGDYGGHQDHVHTRQSQSLDGTGSMEGITAGGGMLSAMAMEIMSNWNTAKTDLDNKIKAFAGDSKTGIAKDIPGAMFKKATGELEKIFQAKLPTDATGSGGAPIDWNGLPADIKSNIELGKYAAEQVGWTGSEWEALKTLWHSESGWDNNAQNPTSTAYGIGQFLDSTWAGFGPKTADPKKQIEYGIKYIKGRQDYGGPVNGTPAKALAMWQSRNPHWYDQGGLANGKGAMMKNTLEPERVLSPRQTSSFDRLVGLIDGVFGSNVKRDTLSAPITGDDYMSKLTNLDTSRPSAMSEKEYNPKSQEEIMKSLQPIFNAFQSFIQQEVVPGVIKYTTELIQMKTDTERLDKVSNDIIAGIEGIHVPNHNEVQMVFGGTVYGDGHLTQIMEDYKRQILSEVRALSEEAARRVSGK